MSFCTARPQPTESSRQEDGEEQTQVEDEASIEEDWRSPQAAAGPRIVEAAHMLAVVGNQADLDVDNRHSHAAGHHMELHGVSVR